MSRTRSFTRFLELVLLFALGSFTFWNCSPQQSGRKILYYANPMVPTIHSDKPMKDPMGMDYIPVYEDELNNEGVTAEAHDVSHNKNDVESHITIKLTPEKQQLIGVKYGLAEKKVLKKHISTVGKIAHETEIYNLQQEYLSALNYYQEAKKANSSESINAARLLLDSTAFKLKLQGFTQIQIDNLGRSGVSDISLILNNSSSRIKKGWVTAAIYETDLPYVKTGQKVTISIPSLPGKQFSGSIIVIEPVLNPASRTAKARVSVQDLDLNLLHEVYVNILIEVPLGERLVIPEEAALDTGQMQLVFVAKEQGYFEPRKVVLGQKAGGDYEVLEGLQAGERVVTSANFLIDSESQFQAALKQM